MPEVHLHFLFLIASNVLALEVVLAFYCLELNVALGSVESLYSRKPTIQYLQIYFKLTFPKFQVTLT